MLTQPLMQEEKKCLKEDSPTPHFKRLVLTLLSSSLSSLTGVVPFVWGAEGLAEREECEGHGSCCTRQAPTEAPGHET